MIVDYNVWNLIAVMSFLSFAQNHNIYMNFSDDDQHDYLFLNNFLNNLDPPSISQPPLPLSSQHQDSSSPIVINQEHHHSYPKVEQQSQKDLSGDMKPQNQDQGSTNKTKKSSDSTRCIGSRSRMAYNQELIKLKNDSLKNPYKYNSKQRNEGGAVWNKEEKRENNRNSAKLSRERKKDYIELLCTKNKQNQKIIQDLKEELHRVKLERDRLRENHEEIKSFYRSRQDAIQSLQDKLSSQMGQFDSQIQDLFALFGTAGQQRTAVTNYYVTEISQLLLCDIHKYFMSQNPFMKRRANAQQQVSVLEMEFMAQLDLDKAQISKLLQKGRARFIKQSGVYKTLAQEFHRLYESLQNQGRVIEASFKEMFKEFDKRQLAKLILWIQQNKFTSKELKRIRNCWVTQLKTGEESHQQLRKQTKH